MFSFATQAALVAVIVGIATAIAVLPRGRRSLTTRYALFAISAALFYLISLLRVFVDQYNFDPPHIITAALILVSGTRFFQALLSDHGIRAARRGRLAWIAALALIALALSPVASHLAARSVAAVLAISLLGSLVLTMEMRAREVESEAERWRLRYVTVGGACVLLAATGDLISGLGIPVPQVGGIVTAIYLYFLSQIMVRQRLLDLHELLGKAAVFSALALTLAAVYGLFVLWAGDTGVFVFNTLLASAIILILYDPIRGWLEETVARNFFHRQRDFSRTLTGLSRSLLNLVDSDEVQTRILDTIYNSKRATHCAFYLLGKEGTGLELASFRGPRPANRFEPAYERVLLDKVTENRSPLIRETLSHTEELVTDGTEDKNGTDNNTPLLEAMDAMSSDLCIPIVGNTRVLGLLTLRDERISTAFTNDQINQLIRVADLVAVALENSQVIERIRERDRLALLGEMAAGLAHEIRNPLGAIKSSVQYLEPNSADQESREFLHIISAEVDRLDRVVSQFLDYARPTGGTFFPFDLNDAIRKTLKLLQAGEVPEGVQITLNLGEDLPRVSGDIDQIRQVIINLVLNAIQAMESGGQLILTTEHVTSSMNTNEGTVVLRVKDTGTGVPPEVRGKLFAPFFSTRKHGTGLGLAICKRIVEAHGGRIGIRSRPDEGSEFSIQLPANLALKLDPPVESNPPQQQPAPPEVEETSTPPAADA